MVSSLTLASRRSFAACSRALCAGIAPPVAVDVDNDDDDDDDDGDVNDAVVDDDDDEDEDDDDCATADDAGLT